MTLRPELAAVTERIVRRSAPRRAAYLDRIHRAREAGPNRSRLACGNLAHGFAACAAGDGGACRRRGAEPRHRHRLQRHALRASALRALSRPDPRGRARGRRDGAGRRRRAGHVRRRHPGPDRHGAVAVLARRDRHVGRHRAVPRHVRRRRLARHLRQDRAGPADRRAAPSGTCRRCSCPAGRCRRACPTTRRRASASSTRRARSAATNCWRPKSQSYHSPGTCTFYGTANSNQMLMEIMGLHLPGASFVNPNTPLRDALTAAAAKRARGDHRARQRIHARRRRDRRARHRQRHRRAASPPAARPTTRCTSSPSPPPPASRSTGTISPTSPTSCRCSRASIRTAWPT